jgi:hypothetical protein
MQMGSIRSASLLALLSLGLLAGSGCTSLPQMGMPDLSALMPSTTKTPPKQVVSLGKCTVEFRDSNGELAGTSQLDVGEETVVTELLHRSRAFSRYNRVLVHLDRKTPNGPPCRMDVHVDKTKRRAVEHEDYHIRPGDKLVVHEDPRTILDDMMSQATNGMLGRAAPKTR